MKKILFILGAFLLSSCGAVTPDPERYVLFTINTQEFAYLEESIETMERLLDIHEKYSVPVDVYLTEDILRYYDAYAPELVERLKSSPVVAVSYHYRPPQPFHNSAYDFLGLDQMDEAELYATLLDYEEHATNPVTGEPTDTAGGYEHVKEVMGYAPVVVGMAAPSRAVGDTLGQIYKEKGATFAVSHAGEIALGEQQFGLFLRPETIEVKLFEQTDQDAESIFALWGDAESGFMNIKVHDNDFIADQSAWVSIYLKQKPPYELERGNTERELLTEEESAPLWTLYESSVEWVSSHPELYQAINAFDLQAMVAGE